VRHPLATGLGRVADDFDSPAEMLSDGTVVQAVRQFTSTAQGTGDALAFTTFLAQSQHPRHEVQGRRRRGRTRSPARPRLWLRWVLRKPVSPRPSQAGDKHPWPQRLTGLTAAAQIVTDAGRGHFSG